MGSTMTVHPDEIRKCAKQIGRLSATSTKLDELANSNEVPQLSWGALGNLVGLYQQYDETLQQLHDHFTKMGEGFGKLGNALGDTAESYHENERVAKDQFDQVMGKLMDAAKAPQPHGGGSASASGNGNGLAGSYKDQYGGENLGKAAEKAVPFGGPAYGTVKDAIKLGKDAKDGHGADVASDSAHLVADMGSYVASAGEVMGAAADPLNWLISKGLGFLLDVVSPLKQCVDLVTGDPDATGKAADGFRKIGEDTKQLAGTYDEHLHEGLRSWSGDAAQSAAKRLVDFHDGIEGTAGTAAHVASVLQASSMLMKVAEEVVKGILSDLVEWLIITWVAALAAAVPTAGGSTAAAGAATPAEAAAGTARGASEVNKVRRLIMKIMEFLKKIKSVLHNHAMKGMEKINNTGAGHKALQKFMGPDGKGGKYYKDVKEFGWKDAAKGKLGDKTKENLQKQVGDPRYEDDASKRVGAYGESVKTWTDRVAGGTKGIRDRLDGQSDDNDEIEDDLDV